MSPFRLIRCVVIAAGLAVVVVVVKALPLRPNPESSLRSTTTTATRSTPPVTTTTAALDPSSTVPTASSLVGPSEPPALSVATLPPRPIAIRLAPEALASRFVAEWLTYPPGREAPSALAARLSELVTSRHRRAIERLSTAGMANRPGSVAVMGATTPLAADGVYRVTAWQTQYGPSSEFVGPYSWDVTVVPVGAGGWLVDGMRRAG